MTTFAESRRAYIGGTDIAKLLGVSPWGGPYDVWLDKTGQGQPFDGNAATTRGTYFEPSVAKWYADQKGVTLIKGETQTHPDPSLPFLAGNPDYLIAGNDTRILEIKTASFRQLHELDAEGAPLWGQDGDSGADAVPLHYYLQCQWYMGICDALDCDLAVHFMGADEFRVYHLSLDQELWNTAVDAAIAFWRDHVLTGTPPAMDLIPSDQARAYLLNKVVAGKNVAAATPETEGLALELYHIQKQAKALEQEEAVLKGALAQHLAVLGAQKIEGKYYGAKWSIAAQGGGSGSKTNHEALAKDLAAAALRLGMSEEEAEGLQTSHTSTFTKTPYVRGYFTGLDKTLGSASTSTDAA